MGMVLFVLLLLFMPMSIVDLPIIGADLPNAQHPVSMPGAGREDALKVTIMRNGQVYLGSDHILAADLAGKIQDRLQHRGVERKVYITADARARWGQVKQVLDGIRSAGILRVAFLAEQRRTIAPVP